MKKYKNKCPCKKLLNAQKEIEKFKGQIQLMHNAANRIMVEYGRLHFEEKTLKDIVDLCDEDVLSPELIMKRLQEVKNICKNAKEILVGINRNLPKL